MLEEVVTAINNAALPRAIDYVTLCVAGASLLTAVASLIAARFATIYTREQKNIAQRAERNQITSELFDCLHIVRKFNGSNLDDELLDHTFKRLQKLQLKACDKELFSSESHAFISKVLKIVHEMRTMQNLHEDNADDALREFLNNFGVEVTVEQLQEKFRTDYMEARYFLQKQAFSEFEELFAKYA
ncbi:hypothetical protein [Vibrio parahaemolyticus]|uniref:hypothetical protein n=1 Tax=Vibrio parahaemolyticus TaxID=670 RepID=UPI0003F8AE08|nr:hypothetical protein [Vibrio parahaemolyticus]